MAEHIPLAHRMRPQSFRQFVGQEESVGAGSPLRNAIERGTIPSLIIWGPPGTGKTTLARLLAKEIDAQFLQLSAVDSGVKDLRKVFEQTSSFDRMFHKSTMLFIDEIHRYNKAQQHLLLSHVEVGNLVLVGATTENPGFEVIAPLLSRVKLVHFRALRVEEIVSVLREALADEERGLGKKKLQVQPAVLEFIAERATGDARFALNVLEESVMSLTLGIREITEDHIARVLKKSLIRYDRAGDEHYDAASAFIKSMRGSDPDAAVVWLAKMIRGGEAPRFIARRIVICAAEDVGNADPMALIVAQTAARAVEFIGFPEARILLAQAAIYVATAPKSNAVYRAIDQAIADQEAGIVNPVIPVHLRGAPTRVQKELGYGQDYLYPHEFAGGFTRQSYFPPGMPRTIYYQPKDIGFEARLRKRLAHWWGEGGKTEQDD